MIRQQRRRQIRECQKELSRITNDKFFKKILADRELSELDSEVVDRLAKGEHPDKVLEARFNLYSNLTNRIKYLNSSLEYLNGLVPEKNIPTIHK